MSLAPAHPPREQKGAARAYLLLNINAPLIGFQPVQAITTLELSGVGVTMSKHVTAIATIALVLAGCAAAPTTSPARRATPIRGTTAQQAAAASHRAPTVTRHAPAGAPDGPTAAPVTLPDGGRYMAYAAASTPDDGSDVTVVTFNTAIGNPQIKTDQKHFPTLPFYAATIAGEPDSAILCLQEVGNAQRAEVARLGERSAAFTWRYQRVGARQGNMMLIPRRYVLEKYDDPHFGWVQVVAAGKAIWRWIGPEGKPNMSQLTEPRGFQIAWLRDTRTNRRFVVLNTHLSFQAGIQEPQAKKLFDHAFRAGGDGPLVVAGDLNVRTADTDTDPDKQGKNAVVRSYFRDLVDMGPAGRPPSKTNIDWVLARGFAPVRSRWYTGTSISLPGSPDALTVSDHYAEEDVLRWQ